MYSASRSTGSVRQCSALPGIGRPNKSDRYSMRVRACSNTALNSRCSRRLSRRMSRMKAIEGRSRAIYEKFWSGPTPMYAPPRTSGRSRSGSTCRYERSLEIRLSVSKYPPGSESASICAAKSVVFCCRASPPIAEMAMKRAAILRTSSRRIMRIKTFSCNPVHQAADRRPTRERTARLVLRLHHGLCGPCAESARVTANYRLG